jgi:uncharacterized membrane protein YphA (DoxX/SURF4 family)
MDALLKAARFIFALAMVGFGVQFFFFVTSMSGPVPGPPWTHRTAFLCLLACVGFILAGVSIATGKMARLVSVLLGAVMLLYAYCGDEWWGLGFGREFSCGREKISAIGHYREEDG